MVLADLGRKITNALRSLNNATIINKEVNISASHLKILIWFQITCAFLNKFSQLLSLFQNYVSFDFSIICVYSSSPVNHILYNVSLTNVYILL